MIFSCGGNDFSGFYSRTFTTRQAFASAKGFINFAFCILHFAFSNSPLNPNLPFRPLRLPPRRQPNNQHQVVGLYLSLVGGAATADFPALGTLGEAFDKISRALGLGYPGGPIVDKMAKEGSPNAIKFPKVHFNDSLDFSFSGVKTSVLNYLNNSAARGEAINTADVCASFQKAVVDILVENLIKAAQLKGYGKICLAGGVAANSALRQAAETAAHNAGIEFYRPSPILCTDNGAMIASAAYFVMNKRKAGNDLNAFANVSIENIDGLFNNIAN